VIVSDRHRFIFVHVPKAAGSSIRRQLLQVDPEAQDLRSIRPHPTLGNVDHGHIALHRMRNHFPELWRAMGEYYSFALIREPMERFGSAIGQWLLASKKLPVVNLSERQLRNEIDEVVALLKEVGEREVPPLLTHFQRQIDFVKLDNKIMVDTVRPLEAIDLLSADLEAALGFHVSPDVWANTAVSNQDKLAARAAYHRAGRIERAIRKLFPKRLLRNLKKIHSLQVEIRLIIKSNNYVREFLRDHYSQDFDLYDSLLKMSRREREALGSPNRIE